MVTRRTELGYANRVQFAEKFGGSPSGRTLGNLERGHSVSAETLSAVERVLGWMPGSALRVLDGLEPIVRDISTGPSAAVAAEPRVHEPEFWADLRLRVPDAVYEELWAIYQERKSLLAERRVTNSDGAKAQS